MSNEISFQLEWVLTDHHLFIRGKEKLPDDVAKQKIRRGDITLITCQELALVDWDPLSGEGTGVTIKTEHGNYNYTGGPITYKWTETPEGATSA